MDYMIREEVVLSVKNPSLKSVWLLRPDNYHKMIVACFGLLVGGKSRASCLFLHAHACTQVKTGRQDGQDMSARQPGRHGRHAHAYASSHFLSLSHSPLLSLMLGSCTAVINFIVWKCIVRPHNRRQAKDKAVADAEEDGSGCVRNAKRQTLPPRLPSCVRSLR